jgi:hypothetical protein
LTKTETEPLRLNIGSGHELTLKGYVNLDAKFGHAAYPLAYADNSVDEIRASHILEHFSLRETDEVLRDWVRALKPGGWLKIAVPDFDFIVKAHSNGNPEGLPLGMYLMGGQIDKDDYHKAIFTRESLTLALKNAGLAHIQPWTSEVKDCAALPVSLNLMAQKPPRIVSASDSSADYSEGPKPAVNGIQPAFVLGAYRDPATLTKERIRVRVAVVMSTPRYGPLDACEAISDIAAHLHAPRFKSGGAFWEQGLTRSIEQALAYRDPGDGAAMDVLVSMDYDTFATPEDAKKLIQLLYQNPQYDCVAALQARRGTFSEILATTAGPVDMTQALVPIVTGHFGLTVFRRRVFEQLKKPWLVGTPSENGDWNDGRTDADIHFWHAFNDAGMKAAIAPGVVIGHGEDAVVYPRVVNGRIEKVYISVYEWLGARSVPENAGVIA